MAKTDHHLPVAGALTSVVNVSDVRVAQADQLADTKVAVEGEQHTDGSAAMAFSWRMIRAAMRTVRVELFVVDEAFVVFAALVDKLAHGSLLVLACCCGGVGRLVQVEADVLAGGDREGGLVAEVADGAERRLDIEEEGRAIGGIESRRHPPRVAHHTRSKQQRRDTQHANDSRRSTGDEERPLSRAKWTT